MYTVLTATIMATTTIMTVAAAVTAMTMATNTAKAVAAVTAAVVVINSATLALRNRKKRGDPLFLRLNNAEEAFLPPVKPCAMAAWL